MNNINFSWFFLLAGVVVAYFTAPVVYQKFSTDFARTELILHTLKEKKVSPEIIMFGSSVLMAGGDAKLLSSELNNEIIVNFSSTGQLLSESKLYYPLVDNTVTKKVLQFISVEELAKGSTLTNVIGRNFLQYGYVLDEYRLFELKEIEILTQSKLDLTLKSRNVFINYVNTKSRNILRKDLELGKVDKELFWPQVYTKRLGHKKYSKLIKKYNPIEELRSFEMDSGVTNNLLKYENYFHNLDVKYVLVLYPVNPDLSNITDEYLNQVVDELKKLNIVFVDLSRSLKSNDFIDHYHPSPDGAKKMTKLLAKKMRLL